MEEERVMVVVGVGGIELELEEERVMVVLGVK